MGRYHKEVRLFDSMSKKSDNKFVTTLVRGGVGNQLFKTAAGIEVARLTNRSLILDLNWYKHQSQNSKLDRRKFELDYFPNISNLRKDDSEGLFSIGSYNFLRYKLGKVASRREITEDNYLSSKNMDFIDKDTLNGSFEDLKYLPSSDQIRDWFAFPDHKTSWLRSELTEIKKKNVVALHVRMGDYLNFPSLYNVLDSTYYQEGLKILKDAIGDFKVTLFSDNIKGALDFLGPTIRIDTIQKSNNKISSTEVLELLSNFKGIVAANSTFSWWAGFLGKVNETCDHVILPKEFVKSNRILGQLDFEGATLINPSINYEMEI